MDRWTMRELKETDDITFAIQILRERRRGLTPYSPLGMKLVEAVHTLSEIKKEKDRYLERVSAVCTAPEAADGLEDDAEVLENVTDLSDCDEETKAQILENAAKLDEKCKNRNPDYKQCDTCEFGGAAVGE